MTYLGTKVLFFIINSTTPGFASWLQTVLIKCKLNQFKDSNVAFDSGRLYGLLGYCWPYVYDAGPKVNQRWANVSSFPGEPIVDGTKYFIAHQKRHRGLVEMSLLIRYMFLPNVPC